MHDEGFQYVRIYSAYVGTWCLYSRLGSTNNHNFNAFGAGAQLYVRFEFFKISLSKTIWVGKWLLQQMHRRVGTSKYYIKTRQIQTFEKFNSDIGAQHV